MAALSHVARRFGQTQPAANRPFWPLKRRRQARKRIMMPASDVCWRTCTKRCRGLGPFVPVLAWVEREPQDLDTCPSDCGCAFCKKGPNWFPLQARVGQNLFKQKGNPKRACFYIWTLHDRLGLVSSPSQNRAPYCTWTTIDETTIP